MGAIGTHLGGDKFMHPDETLVLQSLNGDKDAYNLLVERYQHKIYTLSYRYTGNCADAFDLTQETFIKAYKSLKGFRGEASFSTWIYKIAANVCRDELRKKKRRKTVSLNEMLDSNGNNNLFISEDISPEESVNQKEIQRLVQECLNGLSKEHRLILLMREINGLSYEEIALCLDCSLGTVKSRLSRARKALKKSVLNNKELLLILERP